VRAIPAILALLAASPATAGSEITARRDALIQSYKNCVLTVSLGLPGNKHMVAEQSFFACSTEEEALRAWFAMGPVSPAISDAFVSRIKLDMKRTILADPVAR
jgi:hypothetical protein